MYCNLTKASDSLKRPSGTFACMNMCSTRTNAVENARSKLASITTPRKLAARFLQIGMTCVSFSVQPASVSHCKDKSKKALHPLSILLDRGLMITV